VERTLKTRLYLLFCLSGFVGVLAEQVFEKLLSVVVGATTPAAAIVLGVYFLGLSLGGYLASLLVKRSVPALMGYAAAEIGVALSCISLLFFFDPGAAWYSGLLAWGGHAAWKLTAARACIAGSMILPAAICLGLSFPFLSSLATRVEQNATYYLAKLYCSNLLGAAFCALIAPFLMFPAIGLSGALVTCFAIDTLVAIYAWGLSRRIRSAADMAPEPVAFHWEGRDAMILLIAFTSGLLFFALEVVWTHLVAVVVGTSVYAFSSMLFVVLIGLALGCIRIARKAHRGAAPVRLHGLFFLCASMLLVQVAFWRIGPEAILRLGRYAHNFYTGELVRLVILIALLLPATYAFGMIYPSLFQEKRFAERGAGVLVGYMTGVNAMGCVLGAAMATFLLIPHLGSEWSIRWFTIVLLLCGIGVLWVERDHTSLRQAYVAAPLLATLALGFPGWNRLALTSGANVYFGHGVRFATPAVAQAAAMAVRSLAPSTIPKLVFFHEDSYGGITTVIENREPGQPPEHVLFTNGKFEGDDSEQQDAQAAFALIPAMHVRKRRNALVIGCGTGQSASVLSALDFSTVDIAEISPGILLAAASHFRRLNEDLLHSPKATVYLEDGRNLLLSRPALYDQISIEITSIWFAGATNVYSRDFYELAKRRLRPGGVFQQWFQLHHIGPKEVESIIGTLRSSFPYVSGWLFGGQGVLVATMTPQELQPEGVSAALRYLRQRSPNAETAQFKMNVILSAQLLDTGAVNRLVERRSPVINTDWNRWLEFRTPRYNLSEADWMTVNRENLASLSVLAGRR